MSAQEFEGLIQLYHGIFVYAGIAAALFLVLAVFLFFFFKIPKVFSELTGRGARKAIAQMEEDGATSGNLASGSRKIGEDGRRHRRVRTGSLNTSRLRNRSGGLSGEMPAVQAAASVAPPPLAAASAEGLGSAETTALASGPGGFQVLRSIVEVHTDEVI